MQLLLLPAIMIVALSGAPNAVGNLMQPLHQAMIQNLLPELEEILAEPLPQEQPSISLAPAEQLQRLYCADNTACGVAAVTNRETGEIILQDSFIPNTLFAVSIVFHELVHWVQVKKHKYRDLDDCHRWAMMEMEAYHAQSRFLQRHGHRSFSVPNLTHQCQHNK